MKKTMLILLFLLACIHPVNAQSSEIELESDYYLLLDPQNNQVIYEKSADEPIYPASLTKMMTLIVALEHLDDYDKLITLDHKVFQGLYEANASMAGFSLNEKVSVKDCLYGLFLPSGAECTRALAIETAGSEEDFVVLMNEKAKELNMNSTHFENTTGLHHKDHYTTLHDLSILMKYCLDNPDFYEIFTTKEYIASGSIHKQLKMNSTLFKRLSSEHNEMILGGKTGYTNPAGLCLASVAEKDGRTLMLITAHAPVSSTPYHLLDAITVYTTVFDTMHKLELCNPDVHAIETEVSFTLPKQTVLLYPETALTKTLPNDIRKEDLQYEIQLHNQIEAPLQKNDVLGTLSIYYDDELLDSCSLVCHDEIEASKLSIFFHNASLFIENNWKTASACLSVVVMLMLFKKKFH